MTFYRKYRPQKIDDLDLDGVRNTLKEGVKGGVAQAYLFVGPRGAGKTSAARILAKCVNCLTPKEGEACLECESCKSIETGGAVDVMEIDAASHRGIDAIRELKDKIGLAPGALKKKVYIIDEVHMLTNEAFNALLKTLEEPPEHVMFILCTTEKHKVPETILSRCVEVGFVKGSKEEVLRSLKKVVEGEKLEVEDGVLEELALSVDGSFREGHKLLEQLGNKGKKITVEMVRELLGSVKGVEEKQFAKFLLKGSVREALNELGEAEKAGVNWPLYAEKVLQYLRMQMRARYGLGECEVEESAERIKVVTQRVAQACGEMKQAVLPMLPLEMAAVELQRKESETKIRVQVEEPQEVKKVEVEVEKKMEEIVEGAEKSGEEMDVGVEVSGISIDLVQDKWGNLIRLLEPQNHSLAGLLRSCRPKKIENRFLVIEAFYKFHKEQLEQEARRRMVEEALKKEVGLPAVKFVLGEKAVASSTKMAEHDNVGAPSGDDKLIEAVGDVFGVDV